MAANISLRARLSWRIENQKTELISPMKETAEDILKKHKDQHNKRYDVTRDGDVVFNRWDTAIILKAMEEYATLKSKEIADKIL
jgi:hypothetical protein